MRRRADAAGRSRWNFDHPGVQPPSRKRCPGRSACSINMQEDRNEDRADRTLDGKHSAEALWRLGEDRLLSHRGAGGPGPRRDPVRQRASITAAKLVPCCAQPLRLNSGRARHHPLLHADARQGAQHGARVRRPAFPHRPVPFPDLPRDGAADGHHAARPPGSARPQASLRRLSRHAAGLDLERAARADPGRELRRHRLSRPAARLLTPTLRAAAAAIWPFSAASRRRRASTARSRSPARSACRCKIAAKVDRVDEAYFRSEIEPLLQGPGVEYIGEIDDRHKSKFLGEARALLFPIDWPEPFGLAMIEAMACGTPVLAFRNGAVPEVIDEGVTGYVVDSMDEAVRDARAGAGSRPRPRAPTVRGAVLRQPHGARLRPHLRAADRRACGRARPSAPRPSWRPRPTAAESSTDARSAQGSGSSPSLRLESGLATASSGLRSAATPQRRCYQGRGNHQRPRPAGSRANTLVREPVSISTPNSQGPTTPPTPVPTA